MGGWAARRTLKEAVTTRLFDSTVKSGISGDGLSIFIKQYLEMVPAIGVEPTTFALRMRCSTN
jgi:hypothetical protein